MRDGLPVAVLSALNEGWSLNPNEELSDLFSSCLQRLLWSGEKRSSRVEAVFYLPDSAVGKHASLIRDEHIAAR